MALYLNERMADERQEHRIRRERAEEIQGESRRTKPSSEMNSICREPSELYGHAPPRPRDGGKWVLEVPLQGQPQPPPEPPPSQEWCDQRTRGRAGAHAGPEPAPTSGRNRRRQGQLMTLVSSVALAIREASRQLYTAK
eukprot:5454162-Pleurochrysis_carterae.AAC.1